MKNKSILKSLLFIAISINAFTLEAGVIEVKSPDKKISIYISIEKNIAYSLKYEGKTLVEPSKIGLQIYHGDTLGIFPVLKNHELKEFNETIKVNHYKSATIENNYNELVLYFRNDYALRFRVYNTGFGFRWEISKKEELIIENELFEMTFPEIPNAWMQLCHTYVHGHEFDYTYKSITALNDFSTTFNDDLKALMPVIFDTKPRKIFFSHADVNNYPTMYLTCDYTNSNKVRGVFVKYPLKEQSGGYKFYDLVVTERANYIAKLPGISNLPWKVFFLAGDDKDFMDNNLVYLLNRAPAMDFAWVKPGKCIWDWWTAMTLSGVDFKAGLNTETYKYYIDFASENNIPYINVDDGWSHPVNLNQLNPDIDIPEILKYAKGKNVGVFLWCTAQALDKNLKANMAKFSNWGVAGLKIDFFDRDDQLMNQYYERFAKEAALWKILINYHGCSMPSGLQRTYPNILNAEAVKGLEYNKGDDHGTSPELAVLLPFTRMGCGPFDYTPGALRNVTRLQYKPVFNNPASIGTRCQQLAMYVVYDMPLGILADRASDYRKEPEILSFITNVPSFWDETIALDGKIGEFAVVARRTGKKWYVGALTNSTERTISINFSFLKEGNYKAVIFHDGENAHMLPSDYKRREETITGTIRKDFVLKPGGGMVIEILPL